MLGIQEEEEEDSAWPSKNFQSIYAATNNDKMSYVVVICSIMGTQKKEIIFPSGVGLKVHGRKGERFYGEEDI